MTNRSQKIFQLMKSDTGIAIKVTHKLHPVSAEQHAPEGASQDCPQMWKELFLEAVFFEALLESDKKKLTELLQAAERVMVLRAQELLNSAGHLEERREMDNALAALLSIKTHKFRPLASFAREGLK